MNLGLLTHGPWPMNSPPTYNLIFNPFSHSIRLADSHPIKILTILLLLNITSDLHGTQGNNQAIIVLRVTIVIMFISHAYSHPFFSLAANVRWGTFLGSSNWELSLLYSLWGFPTFRSTCSLFRHSS